MADALVDAVVRMDPRFFEIAGRGFKDTTRIAASDPQMWREIFQENRKGLAEALGAFRAALDELERLIDAGDATAIEAALDRIRRVRETVGEGSRRRAERIRESSTGVETVKAGQRDIVVTIDGPAGAGKSTVAAELARRLGFTLIDTGALYRGLAWAVQEAGVALEDGPALAAVLDRTTRAAGRRARPRGRPGRQRGDPHARDQPAHVAVDDAGRGER